MERARIYFVIKRSQELARQTFKIEMPGFELKDEANLETLIQDVLQTSEIEGEILNPELVRSSIATRLGLEYSGLKHSDREVDGIVELMLDATQNDDKTLTAERLFGWYVALFPLGRSGMHKIEVANWRSGACRSFQEEWVGK